MLKLSQRWLIQLPYNLSFTQFNSDVPIIKQSIRLHCRLIGWLLYAQLTFTCSKSTIETLKKGVKYVQS